MSTQLGEGIAMSENGALTDGPTALYTLPPLGKFVITSLIATIDASAAGNVTAQLNVSDKSGVVVATKRQTDVIPAGGTGTATWALRLAAESAAGGGGVTSIVSPDGSLTVTNPAGPAVDVGFEPWTLALGSVLFGGSGYSQQTTYPLEKGGVAGKIGSVTCPILARVGDHCSCSIVNGGTVSHKYQLFHALFVNTVTGAWEDVLGNQVTFGPGLGGNIPFNTRFQGGTFMNLTTPNAPVFTVAGTYIVSVSVVATY